MSLVFDGVERGFDRTQVIRDASFEVDGTVALFGRNGAGKTTLLRLAAGLLRPWKGQVLHGGHDPLHARGRHGLAYVPQDAPVFPELDALEQVRWWTRLHGRTVDAAGVVQEAGLGRVATQPGHTLSRGQRQRLALATAFACGPTTLLLDEPATALDADGVAWLRQRIEDTDAHILMAVHDETTVADRRIHLIDGVVT